MKIFLFITLFAFLFVVYVRYLEKNSLFFPSKVLTSTPDDIGLEFKDVTFKTEGHLQLHGWFIEASEDVPTILFLHGNAGNISDRLGKIKLFHDIGLNVFIFDYRGYGQSQGVPTEESLYTDAVAAYDYLQTADYVKDKRVIAYGASLGGAPAVDLATKKELAAFVIDSSFSNAVDMARRIYPFIPSFLISLKLDSIGKIKNAKAPKLFIHSSQDMTVPIELGRKLYDAANEPKQFLEITGAHNDGHLYEESKFRNTLYQFFKDLGFI